MAKRGRKPADIQCLIMMEWQWWVTFSYLRDGVAGEQEIEGGWSPPDDYEYPLPPAGMTDPGAIHDWEQKARKDWLSQWQHKTSISKEVPPERHLWEALKRAQTVRQVRRICN